MWPGLFLLGNRWLLRLTKLRCRFPLPLLALLRTPFNFAWCPRLRTEVEFHVVSSIMHFCFHFQVMSAITLFWLWIWTVTDLERKCPLDYYWFLHSIFVFVVYGLFIFTWNWLSWLLFKTELFLVVLFHHSRTSLCLSNSNTLQLQIF